MFPGEAIWKVLPVSALTSPPKIPLVPGQVAPAEQIAS
jgi:hypothetical protein